MNFSKHVKEEKLIDLAFGNITGQERITIENHLAGCPHCRRIWEYWMRQIRKELSDSSMAERIPEPSDSLLPEGTERENSADPVLSGKTTLSRPYPESRSIAPPPLSAPEGLKERLWVLAKEMKGAPRNWKRLRPAFVSVLALFLVGVILLGSNFRIISHQSYEVSKNDDIPVNFIQSKPDTKELHITPVADNPQMNGSLWLNNASHEMLLEVEGLPEYPNQDHQLWIFYIDNDVTGEILPVKNGTTRIFFRGIDVGQFKLIKASVEPKGGSPEPTGPSSFLIQLSD